MSTSLTKSVLETETFFAYIHSPMGEPDQRGYFWPNAENYWNFRPQSISGMWEYVVGEDWWYLWDTEEMSEFWPLMGRVVDALERAAIQWPETVYQASLDVEYVTKIPVDRQQMPWGRYAWGSSDELWRFRGGKGNPKRGKGVGGFVRKVMIAPVQLQEHSSWIASEENGLLR